MSTNLLLRVGLAVAVAAYVGLAARHLTLPGMYVDEALPLIGIHDAEPENVSPEGQWLMNAPYAGAIKGLILAVPFRLFGFRVEVLRFTAIAVTAGGLIFAALLAWRMCGGFPALAATWLLATDPSLILYTKADWGSVAMGFTFRTALLYWLWRWWDGGGRAPLVAAGLCAGLGLWDKATFAWVLVAVLLVGIVAWFTDRGRPSLSLADATWAAAACLVSSSPFWIYNLNEHWATVRSIARPGDPENLAGILALSATRTIALREMFNGAATARWMFGTDVPAHFGFAHTWLLPLSIVAAFVCVIGGVTARRVWAWAIPALIGAILAQIYLTPRSVWVHQWITVYPLPQLAIGWAWSSTRRSSDR